MTGLRTEEKPRGEHSTSRIGIGLRLDIVHSFGVNFSEAELMQ